MEFFFCSCFYVEKDRLFRNDCSRRLREREEISAGFLSESAERIIFGTVSKIFFIFFGSIDQGFVKIILQDIFECFYDEFKIKFKIFLRFESCANTKEATLRS